MSFVIMSGIFVQFLPAIVSQLPYTSLATLAQCVSLPKFGGLE